VPIHVLESLTVRTVSERVRPDGIKSVLAAAKLRAERAGHAHIADVPLDVLETKLKALRAAH
jgi:hypothetical protein